MPLLLRVKTDTGFGGRGRKLKQNHHKKSTSISEGEKFLTRDDALSANPACGLKMDDFVCKAQVSLQPVEDTYVLSVSPTMELPENLDIGSALQTHEYTLMLLQASETLNAPRIPPKTDMNVQTDCFPIALNKRLRELPVVPYHRHSTSPNASSIPSNTTIASSATTHKHRYTRPRNVPAGARAPPNRRTSTLSRSMGRSSTYARAAWDVDAGRFTSLVGVSKAIMEDNVRVLRAVTEIGVAICK